MLIAVFLGAIFTRIVVGWLSGVFSNCWNSFLGTGFMISVFLLPKKPVGDTFDKIAPDTIFQTGEDEVSPFGRGQ